MHCYCVLNVLILNGHGSEVGGGGGKIWPYIESVLVLFYLDLVFQPVSCNA